MCALVGMIGNDRDTLEYILDKSKARGRDGFGCYDRGDLYIANFRAEPTTEYVKDKRSCDQQPYRLGSWSIVHNGTIANDKEIRTYKHPSTIDSAAIVETLQTHDFQSTITQLRGSYAILAIDETDPQALYVAVNYQALWYVVTNTATLFASSRDFFPPELFPKPIEPYSTWMFNRYGSLRLSPIRILNKRALVVASGGLDSTVAACQMIADGYEIELLHFLYGSRAERPEVKAVKAIAERLGVPYHLFPLPIYRPEDSPLLDPEAKIAGGEAGAEFALEWCPARNLVMLSIATAFAEARGIETIALGNNIEEAGCVGADSRVTVRRQANKLEYTIEQLYNLMKGDKLKVRYGMRWDRTQETLIRTMFPDGTIGYNVIEDIFYAGEKSGYKIDLENGHSVSSSADHEWFTTEGWQTADKLSVGDVVFCNSIPKTKEAELLMRQRLADAKRGDKNPNKKRENADRIRRTLNQQRGNEWFDGNYWRVTGMSFHPNVNANGFIPKHRLVVEADMNSVTFENWIEKCRIGAWIGDEVFLDPKFEVHHTDENVHNNELSNLEPLTTSEHTLRHLQMDPGRSRRAVQQAHGLLIHPVKIISVEKIGPLPMYDLHVRGTANYVACNMVGHNSYPDNTQEFIDRFNGILPYAVADGKRVQVIEPVGNLTKREIVALGHKLGAPLDTTWSCYRAGNAHCGRCGPCWMRRTAHEINGLVDPVFLEDA